MDNTSILDIFKCPITLNIMINPVIAEDGHTYEKDAIIKWLNIHHTSPITRINMSIEKLLPNITIKNAINQFLKSNEHKDLISDNIHSTFIIPKISDFSIGACPINNDTTLISIIPPLKPIYDRLPCSFICVLDVSGSMNLPAHEKNNLELSTTKLSVLDLVKHSIKTIVKCLNEKDNLALITFGDFATVISPLKCMNSSNKEEILTDLSYIKAEGCTNLCSGFEAGMKLVNNPICDNTNVVVLIFTDGEATASYSPKEGLQQSILTLLEKKRNASVHTFGFGYKLDSYLLSMIAEAGQGIFGFIPDASMTGTVFINFMAFILSSSTNNILTFRQKSRPANLEDQVIIGNIGFGQCRCFEIKAPINDIEVLYGDNLIPTDLLQIDLKNYEFDQIRLKLIYTLNLFLDDTSHIVQSTHENRVYSRSKKSNFVLISEKYQIALIKLFDFPTDNKFILDLKRDITSDNLKEGQILKSISREDWFIKWGRPYLLSIISAHKMQYRCNFKDPGVQFYGGELFNSIQDNAFELFCSLAPPVPSINLNDRSTTFANLNPNKKSQGLFDGVVNYLFSNEDEKVDKSPASTTFADVDMSDYLNKDGGCFTGEWLVLMKNGETRLVKDVRKGDLLFNGVVECVVKSIVYSPTLVNLPNGFSISPYHPIMINSKWLFPCNRFSSFKTFGLVELFDFVLVNRKHIIINGLTVASWGHGCNFDPILAHPFYGTEKIVQCLSTHENWNNGYIILDKNCKFRREVISDMVISISF